MNLSAQLAPAAYLGMGTSQPELAGTADGLANLSAGKADARRQPIIRSADIARHRLGIGQPVLLDPALWGDPIITSEQRKQQRRLERWEHRKAQYRAGQRPGLELWGIASCHRPLLGI